MTTSKGRSFDSATTNGGTIGFRLDTEARAVLDQRAEAFGLSAHNLSKHIVLEYLMGPEERREIRDEIALLKKQVSELREEFAHALQVILVSAGKVPNDEAEKWVEENFNRD